MTGLNKEVIAGVIEEQEHKSTYDWIENFIRENGRMPPFDLFTLHIAMDHLKETPDYYAKLQEVGV
jgi:hypothetical protein